MIRCGHCGGRHQSVTGVRSCSGTPTTAGEPVPETTPAAKSVAALALAPDWYGLAGPSALGRSVLVEPGQAPPEPWAEAARVAVSVEAVDPGTLDRLQAAWSRREPVVIELSGHLPQDDPPWSGDFWDLRPEHWVGHERLRHLITANTVDARSPDHPTFAPTSAATAAGAVPTDGNGDVVGPDGTAVWCDGGPLDWRLDTGDAAVVPMIHLEGGSLRPLRRAEPTTDLADDQLEAVRHVGGGARIIAPAGSGKTRVLTERARHLVRDVGVEARSVCLVAFNVRAREEMQERTADLTGLEVRTLNSLALAILRGTGPFRSPAGRRAPEVIDERAVRQVLDDLIRTRHRAMSDPFAVWIEALSACRLGLRAPVDVEQDFGGDVPGLADVLPRYRSALSRAGVVDFDEQILGAIEVLLTDPAARTSARQACGLLLVDEFQDLTPAHVLMVRLLAGPRADVFGVGDDDQTIYGYAGASPRWLIDFERLFPGSGRHDLHVNYRCPPELVEAASSLLSHNVGRIDKTVEAAPGRAGGATIVDQPVVSTVETDEPLTAAVGRVKALLDGGVPPGAIALLARVNATLLAPMIGFAEAKIPTNAPLDTSFLARTGVAGALAWLELASGPARRLDGSRVGVAARRPPRGLSRRVVEWMSEQSSPESLMALAGRMRERRDRDKIEGFVADLGRLSDLAAAGATTRELLVTIRDDTGLGGALEDRLDASRRSVDRSAHGDDLAALLAIADLEPDPTELPRWLTRHLTRDPVHPVHPVHPVRHGAVHLSTVHRVKGRQWPHVVVYEATAGMFPHRLSLEPEEERRVFHVAITRASESLLVVSGRPPSPFVAQLSEARDPAANPEPASAEPASSRPRPRATARSTKQAEGTKKPIPEPGSVAEAERRERLRSWRLERSRTDSVPAYVVFSDATLHELARLAPTSGEELLAVPGIGPAKVDKYGDEMLAIIAAES